MEKHLEFEETETEVRIEDSEIIEDMNYWTSNVYGGYSDICCIMSDSQNCVGG